MRTRQHPPALPARRRLHALLGVVMAMALAHARAQPNPADMQRALDLVQATAQAAALARSAAGARVQVQAGTLDSRLRLAPCADVQPFLAAGAPAWGRTRVGLRCAQGAVNWKVYLPVTVQVWAPAWAGAGALPAGSELTVKQLAQVEVDWAASPGAPYFINAADLAGRSLARALPAGQALRSTDLLPRRWFASGDTVSITLRGAGFAINAEGQALMPGLEGQAVRVRTDNGRVLNGRAVAERRVEVIL
jgi:flagellar basal body P-ring formation protein FlgA